MACEQTKVMHGTRMAHLFWSPGLFRKQKRQSGTYVWLLGFLFFIF